MRWRLVLLLLCGSVARAGELEAAQAAVVKAAKSVRPAVVTVITPNPRDVDLTGVVIASGGVVLTVRSPLLADGTVPKRVLVRFPGRRTTLDATLIDDDPATDTVLYKAPGARVKPISVARAADARHGMWVLLVGNTFGQGRESTPTISLGVISGIRRDGDHVAAFHSSAMVNPGSVGAPIVDLTGDLLGIAAPHVTPAGQQTVVIPFDAIREAYRAAGRKGARVVGRPPPPRRMRNHIVDLLGPVLEDAGRRASRALVAVRAMPLPGDAPEKGNEKKEDHGQEGEKGRKKPHAPPPPRRVSGERPAHDRSSGLVVDGSGLILCPLRITGWPQETRPLKVDLTNGESYDATLLGTDERLRLALLRIPAHGLAVLEPAPREAYRAGHFAVALGYPHEKPGQQTPQLTFGILSRTHALAMVHPAFSALETDAAVSAANRGGPLVDIDGRLLGILLDVNDTDVGGYRSKGRGRFTGNAGLGFAVPWSVLEKLVPRLARGEALKPAFFGVRTVETPNGLEVVEVVAKNSKGDPSAASSAGVKKGDRLLAIGGREVKRALDLRRVLGGLAEGDRTAVVLRRGDQRLELEVTLTGP